MTMNDQSLDSIFCLSIVLVCLAVDHQVKSGRHRIPRLRCRLVLQEIQHMILSRIRQCKRPLQDLVL
jgi:hypothetical protein